MTKSRQQTQQQGFPAPLYPCLRRMKCLCAYRLHLNIQCLDISLVLVWDLTKISAFFAFNRILKIEQDSVCGEGRDLRMSSVMIRQYDSICKFLNLAKRREEMLILSLCRIPSERYPSHSKIGTSDPQRRKRLSDRFEANHRPIRITHTHTSSATSNNHPPLLIL